MDIKKQNKLEEKKEPSVEVVDYTEEEKDYRDMLIKRLEGARNQREDEHTELDDMSYTTYYESNAKAANAYIEPKKNKTDARVVTGTTQEKGMTLLSAILNYNLEPDIVAFDKQDMKINELGENMEDLIKKSRIIEAYDDKRALIYKELLDQGTVYVEELYIEKFDVEKKLNANWNEGVKIDKIDWTSKLKKVYEGCQCNLLSGLKVFLGNMKQFHINKQPYVFTCEIMPYAQAMSVFGNWERWQYVPKKMQRITDDGDTDYDNWTLQEVEENMVEVIKYQDKYANDYMIVLNGVMMLPAEFPLTAVSPSGEYTIAKGDIEPISEFFALSKSIPAKTKTDQASLDEMLKLIILKTQQSFAPPMANNTDRVLGKDIFMPGKITQDIDGNQLQPIIPVGGVNPSEFNAFQLIKDIISEKSVAPSFGGNQTAGKQTATEILELKKQQLMKLGLAVYGIVSLEKQLSWLRLNNIIENWTKPVDKKVDKLKGELVDVYKTVSVESTLEQGQKGMKVFDFDKDMSNIPPENIKAEEDFINDNNQGQLPVRKVYINPEILRTVKYNWYINITPTEKNTNELDRVLFVQNIQDAAQIFGIQTLNMDYLKERFAIITKEDPSKFFVQGQPAQPMMEGETPQLGGEMGKQLAQGVQQPSLNKVVGQ